MMKQSLYIEQAYLKEYWNVKHYLMVEQDENVEEKHVKNAEEKHVKNAEEKEKKNA